MNKRTKYIIRVLITVAAVYLGFRYLLPLFIPFIIAYALAYFLNPIVNMFENKLHIKRWISASITLIIVTGFLGAAIVYIISIAIRQLKNLILNIGSYENIFNGAIENVCCTIEKYSGINHGNIQNYVYKSIDNIGSFGQTEAIYKIMGTSVNTVIGIIEIFVIVFTAIIAAYYMIVTSKEISEKKKKSIFYNDISKVIGKVSRVILAYIKTQLIIMIITTIICFISFTIIGNPYALIIGIGVGILDALPLFGVGAILIPWILILFLTGKYYKGIILLITFIVCYIFREITEPKLMGNKIGISPLMTIISIYVGYKVFGLLGVILGPIAYIIILTVLENSKENNDEKGI